MKGFKGVERAHNIKLVFVAKQNKAEIARDDHMVRRELRGSIEEALLTQANYLRLRNFDLSRVGNLYNYGGDAEIGGNECWYVRYQLDVSIGYRIEIDNEVKNEFILDTIGFNTVFDATLLLQNVIKEKFENSLTLSILASEEYSVDL